MRPRQRPRVAVPAVELLMALNASAIVRLMLEHFRRRLAAGRITPEELEKAADNLRQMAWDGERQT